MRAVRNRWPCSTIGFITLATFTGFEGLLMSASERRYGLARESRHACCSAEGSRTGRRATGVPRSSSCFDRGRRRVALRRPLCCSCLFDVGKVSGTSASSYPTGSASRLRATARPVEGRASYIPPRSENARCITERRRRLVERSHDDVPVAVLRRRSRRASRCRLRGALHAARGYPHECERDAERSCDERDLPRSSTGAPWRTDRQRRTAGRSQRTR